MRLVHETDQNRRLTTGASRMLRHEISDVPYLVVNHNPTIRWIVVLSHLVSGDKLGELHDIAHVQYMPV